MTTLPRINTGTVGNDGTGDKLKQAGVKINAAFDIIEAGLDSTDITAAVNASAASAASAASSLSQTIVLEAEVEAAVSLLDPLLDLANTAGTGIVRRPTSSTWSLGTDIQTAEIGNDQVTDAKLRNSTALSVIGRASNTTGDTADIAAANDGEVLRRSGTSIGFGTIATAGLANDAVTYAKIQNVSATDRMLGRSTAGAGDVEEIVFTPYMRTLADDTDAATARATLGLTSPATATPSALTKTDDTNVTLTLGGTPATALLQATSLTLSWTGTLSATRGGFGVNVNASSGVPLFAAGVPTFTGVTGTGNFVRDTSPTLVSPALGTPSALVATNVTGTAPGLTAGNVTTNANLTGPITSAGNTTSVASQTGTGSKFVMDTSPTLVTPNLGTPSAVVLTSATGLPVATGISGLATGIAAFLAGPSSANLKAAVTDETGTGPLVFATSPALVTPDLGVATAASVNKTAITAPATGATLAIADGASLNTAGAFGLTLTATATTNSTLPAGTKTLLATDGVGTALTALNGSNISSGTVAPARLGSGSGGSSKFLREDSTFQTIPGGGDALTSGNLSQFAATTSLQLLGVMSDETGTGALVFATSPTLVTPALGTPASGILTNCTFPTLNQNTSGSAGSLSATLAATSGGTGQATLATGDIIYASASNTFSKRSIGSTGNVLTVAGGVPTWAAPAGGSSFTLISAQTIPGGGTTLAFTGLTSNDIIFYFANVKFGSGSGMNYQMSTDGTNWSSQQALGSSATYGTATGSGVDVYNTALFTGVALGLGTIVTGPSTSTGSLPSGTVPIITDSSNAGHNGTFMTLTPTPITAIRFRSGSGSNLDSGVITAYGR